MDYHLSLVIKNRDNTYGKTDRYEIKRRTNIKYNKIKENIDNILYYIHKLKKGNSKKYQISGYFEWKKLSILLKDNKDIIFELIIDNVLQRNVVSQIYASDFMSCCADCGGNMIYKHKKVPLMYIYIKKIN
jgi:hypothetical protein